MIIVHTYIILTLWLFLTNNSDAEKPMHNVVRWQNVIYLQHPSKQGYVILNLLTVGLHKHSRHKLETQNLKNTVHEPDLSAYMNKDWKWGAMAVVQTCTSRPAIIKTWFWGYHSHLNLLEIENGWIGWPQSLLSGLEGLDRKLLWFTKLCSALPLQRTSLKYQFWWRKLDSVILCDYFITPWMKNVQIHRILIFEFQL